MYQDNTRLFCANVGEGEFVVERFALMSCTSLSFSRKLEIHSESNLSNLTNRSLQVVPIETLPPGLYPSFFTSTLSEETSIGAYQPPPPPPSRLVVNAYRLTRAQGRGWPWQMQERRVSACRHREHGHKLKRMSVYILDSLVTSWRRLSTFSSPPGDCVTKPLELWTILRRESHHRVHGAADWSRKIKAGAHKWRDTFCFSVMNLLEIKNNNTILHF